jgi:hypothetical protein
MGNETMRADQPCRMKSSEGIKAREGVAGRDETDPKLLVWLWLYACVRGIGSARELARQGRDHAGFQWQDPPSLCYPTPTAAETTSANHLPPRI